MYHGVWGLVIDSVISGAWRSNSFSNNSRTLPIDLHLSYMGLLSSLKVLIGNSLS